MKAKSTTLTVGLLWHSISSDNLGVGALTLGQMALITEAAQRRGTKVRFIIIGTRGGTPYPIEDYEIAATAEFALRAFKAGKFGAISLLRKCDIVFDIGEGDSFADIYGNKRLAIQVLGKALSRLFGRPLVLSPQTIGPFKSGLGRALGNVGMRMAIRIYARDPLSLELLRSAGFAGRSQEVMDVAFALPFERPVHKQDGRIRIGLNVSGLLYHGGYSGANQFGLTVDYRELIDRSIAFFLAQTVAEVFLVPHVNSDAVEVEDDLRASQKLANRNPGLQVAPRFVSPSAAKSFISGLDFFTGARMHACIAAFSSGVPVIPMAYSRKFNGLFNSLGYSHVLDCLTFSTQGGFDLLAKGFEQRTQLKLAVDEGNAIAQRKLEKYVTELAAVLPV